MPYHLVMMYTPRGKTLPAMRPKPTLGMGDFFAKVRMRPPRKLPAPKPSINFSYFPGWYGSFIPLPYMMNVPRVGTMNPPTVVMEFVALCEASMRNYLFGVFNGYGEGERRHGGKYEENGMDAVAPMYSISNVFKTFSV